MSLVRNPLREMELMRCFRVSGILACLLAVAGCSQNFEKGDVNPPPRPMAAKVANPHVAAPQAAPKGMTPMSERTYATDKKQVADEKSIAGTITIAPELAGRIPLVILNAETSRCYGRIRAMLERQGTPIGANDTWIAAQALALGTVMVTDNVGEFSRVAGLAVETWLIEG